MPDTSQPLKLSDGWRPRLHPDRSGLTTAERNAVILRKRGAREAAAKVLGWTQKERWTMGTAEQFLEKEILRIKAKVKALAERRPVEPAPEPPKPKPQRREPIMIDEIEETTDAIETPPAPRRASEFETVLISNIEGRIAEIDQTLGPFLPMIEERNRLVAAKEALEPVAETPDQLDEREAEPAPPPLEKLDEREQEVPPPPATPPVREDEPEDSVGFEVPNLLTVREWIVAEFEIGERFAAGAVRKRFPGLSRVTATMRMRALLEEGVVQKQGQRASTRYFRP